MAWVLLLVALFADLEEDRRELLRLLRDRQDPRELVGPRERAVRQVARHDEPEVVGVLLSAYETLEKDAVDLEREREASDRPSAVSRLRLDSLRVVQGLLKQALRELQDPGARTTLLERLLKDKDLDHSLRVSLTRGWPDLPEEAVAAVVRSLGSRDTGEVLMALGLARSPGEALVAPVAALLNHRDPAVRVEAARVLARLAQAGGIAPLVQRLDQEEGRVQRQLAESLEVLTGVNLGVSPGAWQRWWAEEGPAWLAGGRPLGQGVSTVRPTALSGYYFDIPQDGAAILYLVDISNSMKVRLERDPQYAGEKGKGPRRLDRAREELKKALAALRPGTRFNVMAFADEAVLFERKMVEAGPQTVRKASAWLDSLEPQLGTLTYDALERAFRSAGRGAKDRYYETGVDTIFLLSDGRPTIRNAGAGRQFLTDKVDRILDAVGRWNVLQRVEVHCVAIGSEERGAFLERLAAQNRGTYKEVR